MLDELDRKQKEAYKKEIKNFFQNLKNRSNELKVNKAEIEALLKKQVEEQWRKKQELWKRQEEARIKLMKEVYAHRYENIEEKKALRRKEKEEKLKERTALEKQTKLWNEEEHEEFMREVKKVQNYKMIISEQIEEKLK